MAIGTVGAILGSAVIGAGTSLFGASKQAKAQKQAVAAQQAGKKEALGLLQPYMDAGTGALGTYETALGLKGGEAQKGYFDSFQTDPGWQAAQEAGLDAVNDRYRLSGQGGGNVRAALMQYGQRGMLDAYTKRLQQLGGLVDTGRAAAGAGASAVTGSANQQSSILSNIGSTQAQGIMNAGNAISGGLSNYATLDMFKQGMSQGRGGVLGPWSTQTVGYASL